MGVLHCLHCRATVSLQPKVRKCAACLRPSLFQCKAASWAGLDCALVEPFVSWILKRQWLSRSSSVLGSCRFLRVESSVRAKPDFLNQRGFLWVLQEPHVGCATTLYIAQLKSGTVLLHAEAAVAVAPLPPGTAGNMTGMTLAGASA